MSLVACPSNQVTARRRTPGGYDGSGTSVSSLNFDYGYDAAWNMAKRTNNATVTSYTLNNLNEMTLATGDNYSRSFDANGNFTGTSYGSNGSLTYTYDDENQLVSIATDTVYTSGSSRWKVEFTYDGRQRLRKRVDSTWNAGSNAFDPSAETHYVYDGMEIVQERTSANNPAVTYTRGVDLSGSLGGAGGIGGLLARSAHQSTSPYQLSTSANYHADGNGNITALADSTGSLVANYRFDAYGNTLASSGTLVSANLMRFSSKLWVLHSFSGTDRGLYYYGYRFYDPTQGKWINRDPLGEKGGLDLYDYVLNNPGNNIDSHGEHFALGVLVCVTIAYIIWEGLEDAAHKGRTALQPDDGEGGQTPHDPEIPFLIPTPPERQRSPFDRAPYRPSPYDGWDPRFTPPSGRNRPPTFRPPRGGVRGYGMESKNMVLIGET